MLFLLEADIELKIKNIAAVFTEKAYHLVNAPDLITAKHKFSKHIHKLHADKFPDYISVKYTKIATEI